MHFSYILLLVSFVAASPIAQTTPAKTPSNGNNQALRDGIQKNLDGQKTELEIIRRMMAELKSVSEHYARDSRMLASTIQEGQRTRANNQRLAAMANSKAIPGLAVVEGAQKVELQQAKSLVSGTFHDDKATNVLEQLRTEVENGTKKNEENKRNA